MIKEEKTISERSNTPPLDWGTLGLSTSLQTLIDKAGYTAPTLIQAKTIPIVLQNKDLIGSARTGSGKTASFCLPMIERFLGRRGTYGLILCPTREIALQTQQTMEMFGHPLGVQSISLIGGTDVKADEAALRTVPQVIVGTPGRICDHLERGNLWLEFIEVLVLDEADKMLDMGFAKELNRIVGDTPKTRQTLLFSATISPSVEKLAHKILNQPEKIAVGASLSVADTVAHELYWVNERQKQRELIRLLKRESCSFIIFTKTKDEATRLWRSIHAAGVHESTYISSNKLQHHREEALQGFKEGKYRVMVATDVAGRGIHVENVGYVVNYDLPREPEDYIHRVGRTGRQENRGRAISFVTRKDVPTIRQIEKILKKPIPERFASEYKETGMERDGRGRRDDADRGRRHRSDSHDSSRAARSSRGREETGRRGHHREERETSSRRGARDWDRDSLDNRDTRSEREATRDGREPRRNDDSEWSERGPRDREPRESRHEGGRRPARERREPHDVRRESRGARRDPREDRYEARDSRGRDAYDEDRDREPRSSRRSPEPDREGRFADRDSHPHSRGADRGRDRQPSRGRHSEPSRRHRDANDDTRGNRPPAPGPDGSAPWGDYDERYSRPEDHAERQRMEGRLRAREEGWDRSPSSSHSESGEGGGRRRRGRRGGRGRNRSRETEGFSERRPPRPMSVPGEGFDSFDKGYDRPRRDARPAEEDLQPDRESRDPRRERGSHGRERHQERGRERHSDSRSGGRGEPRRERSPRERQERYAEDSRRSDEADDNGHAETRGADRGRERHASREPREAHRAPEPESFANLDELDFDRLDRMNREEFEALIAQDTARTHEDDFDRPLRPAVTFHRRGRGGDRNRRSPTNKRHAGPATYDRHGNRISSEKPSGSGSDRGRSRPRRRR